MKRRTFLAGAVIAPVPAIAGAEPDDPPIERMRTAMAEIRDILQSAAPDGAQLEGIVWGGPLAPDTIGAWASKDGRRYKFYDRANQTKIEFG